MKMVVIDFYEPKCITTMKLLLRRTLVRSVILSSKPEVSLLTLSFIKNQQTLIDLRTPKDAYFFG
jgi:hypothetical protein